MSVGGCYISIEEEKVKTIFINKESLSDFVHNNKLYSYSLEQAWDAFRVLFSGFDILGVHPLEGVDLGEACFLINPKEVRELFLILNMTTPQELREIIASDDFQNEEFYWHIFWKKRPDDLIKMVQELKNFFAKTLENNHSLLFYIG